MNAPLGIATDKAGNLYIADSANNVIRMLAPNGIITTIAGNGNGGYSGDNAAATAAKLFRPFDVATDSAGNVYIADYNNQRIREVTVNGVITTIAKRNPARVIPAGTAARPPAPRSTSPRA